MAGPSWLVDSKRIATKIKCASGACDPRRVTWKSNPTRTCPKCFHIIDNSDVVQEWPGLPRGVKFDPSDQELLSHLLAKLRKSDANPHPFIDEFIPTLEGDDGICYTHPQKLPGVKQDGSFSHFFHRTFKAYNTGTRKRRKIQNGDVGDVRWHKTGKTKPVIIDGIHLGCKKIMVLYMSLKGGKPEKTNWVMHQYHLGTGEDEKDGEFVVSKVFYQQQFKQGDKNEGEIPLDAVEHVRLEEEHVISPTFEELVPAEEDPVLGPKSVTPEPPSEKWLRDFDSEETLAQVTVHLVTQTKNEESSMNPDCEKLDDHDNHTTTEDSKWWEGESQFLLDSQQLAEGIAICDEFLQSQSSCGGEEAKESRPHLADYARMGVEHLKRDLEESQNLKSLDQASICLDDTPQDMRLSQLEFGSQDSFLAWAGAPVAD